MDKGGNDEVVPTTRLFRWSDACGACNAPMGGNYFHIIVFKSVSYLNSFSVKFTLIIKKDLKELIQRFKR